MASVLVLFHGFIRRNRKFPCLILAVAILPVTPALISLISASTQPIRGQMTYPFVYACYLPLLYTCFCMIPWKNTFIKYAGKTMSMFIMILGMVFSWRQGMAMNQQAYVSDVLTANRMYV